MDLASGHPGGGRVAPGVAGHHDRGPAGGQRGHVVQSPRGRRRGRHEHQAGDERAFDTIVRTQYNALYAHALRRLTQHEAAEDAVQDTMLRAYRALPNLDGDLALRKAQADVVGSLQERGLLDRVFKNPDALNEGVAQAMQPPLHVVDATESVDRVFADLTAGSPAVVVVEDGRPAGMLTRSDLLEYLADRRNGV